MKRVAVAAGSLVGLAAVGAIGFAVFQHYDHAGFVQDAGRACGSLDTAVPSAPPPAALTLPGTQKLLRVLSQGSTTLVVASAPGARTDIVAVRDSTVQALEREGYRSTGSDAEPGYEAEARLSGKGSATVKVRPLCTGRLEVRYTLLG